MSKRINILTLVLTTLINIITKICYIYKSSRFLLFRKCYAFSAVNVIKDFNHILNSIMKTSPDVLFRKKYSKKIKPHLSVRKTGIAPIQSLALEGAGSFIVLLPL